MLFLNLSFLEGTAPPPYADAVLEREGKKTQQSLFDQAETTYIMEL
jgi:hypothetical protein